MQNLKITLSDWDSPRNPTLRLYIQSELPAGSNRLLINEKGRLKVLRAGMPGKTADFLAAALNAGLLWQLETRPSPLDGFGTLICLEPKWELNLPFPFTKNLAPIVALAESSDWAGPVCQTRLRAYRQQAGIGDPAHRNHPPTRPEVRLFYRFAVAMQTLAAA